MGPLSVRISGGAGSSVQPIGYPAQRSIASEGPDGAVDRPFIGASGPQASTVIETSSNATERLISGKTGERPRWFRHGSITGRPWAVASRRNRRSNPRRVNSTPRLLRLRSPTNQCVNFRGAQVDCR